MVATENILFLGSFYIITVQAQIQSDVNCDLFPQNPLCSLVQVKRLSTLERPQLPLEDRRPLDSRLDQFHNGRDQRFLHPPPPSPPLRQNFRPNNIPNIHRPNHLNNHHRIPIGQNPQNFRPTKRPTNGDSKTAADSNRKKRFFFWYTPADILQAKVNRLRNKLQQLNEPPPQLPNRRPNSNQAYDEYDCVRGKLKPMDNGILQNDGVFQLKGRPILLASPVLLNEQYGASQIKQSKAKRKKSKPLKYAVEMEEPDSNEESDETKVIPYIRDHAPQTEESSESEEVSSETERNEIKKKLKSDFEISPHGDRIEFQVQGHNGPKTYIFGFDTGDGKNRQYRLEERMKDGTVKGQYGYYDAKGKLRTIKYIARPLEGYQEKHHEVNLSDLS